MARVDLSLIIPCYNESEGIPHMRERLLDILPTLRAKSTVELVLVDDGSADSTFRDLQAAFGAWPDTIIVQHERNQGLGAALRTGFAHATGAIIVTADSDGTYPFGEIPAMLALMTPGIDVVTASPYHPQGGVENVPTYRVLLSKSASLMYRVLLDWHIHTYTAMFRAYRREVVQRIHTEADGYLMVTELLVGALLSGFRVAEYPTLLRVRQYGQSKARVMKIMRSHLRFQGNLLVSRITGRTNVSLPKEAR
jgi:dolichol-phosphate mannosyltransferase